MTIAALKVVRTNDMGAFLDAGTGNTSDDILLHKAQQTADVAIGEVVNVFLYLDPKKRLTASMRVPKMRLGQIARLKIINVTHDGAFVDAGAERGIFMPFAEMHGRPQIGEVVWAKLYLDKSGRLAASMKVSDEIRRASKPATGIKRGDKVKGTVFNIIDAGALIFSEEQYIVFIARKEMTRALRIGEVVEARVTYLREDGRLNASLLSVKEKALTGDAARILAYMEAHGGEMPFHDKTPPQTIASVFHLSKAAFKRAVGHLYSERRIDKCDGGFKIVAEVR